MAPKTKEVGGGPTVGLADDFVSSLQSLLNGGGMGPAAAPDAHGTTTGIMSVLQDILAGGKGNAGSAISDMLSKQTERDVNGIRARFGASGGSGFGTGAQQAEAMYRAEAAPRATQAITGLQLQAIMPLLAQLGQFSGMGIAPRQTVQQKSPFSQILNTLTQVGGAAMPFLLPGVGGAATTARNNPSATGVDSLQGYYEDMA